jgi:hypothetical protein
MFTALIMAIASLFTIISIMSTSHIAMMISTSLFVLISIAVSAMISGSMIVRTGRRLKSSHIWIPCRL